MSNYTMGTRTGLLRLSGSRWWAKPTLPGEFLVPLVEVGGFGVAFVEDQAVVQGLGLVGFEGPVVGADVGDQAEGSDVEGGGVAWVVGVIEEGDAVGVSVDGAGVVAPGFGFFAGLVFAFGAGRRGDVGGVGFDGVGDGGGDACGEPAGLDAADVERLDLEDGVAVGCGDVGDDVDAACAVGVGDDLDGAGFREGGFGGALLAVPGELFDEAVGVDPVEADVALLEFLVGPVIGAVDVAVADPDAPLVGVIDLLFGGFGRLLLLETPLVAGDLGAVGDEDGVEVGAVPGGIVGR